MALLKIVTEPDPRIAAPSPRLRQKSAKIERVDDSIRKLAADMYETMMAANGVGLAAPQVGILQRLVVIHVPAGMEYEDDPEINLALVNPEIQRAGGQELGAEGCLSFPDLWGDVSRYTSVTVKAEDTDGKSMKIKARGFLARVLQHEIDHLDGVLFFDRMEDVQQLHHTSEAREASEDGDAA
jgi:peptide deformylase